MQIPALCQSGAQVFHIASFAFGAERMGSKKAIALAAAATLAVAGMSSAATPYIGVNFVGGGGGPGAATTLDPTDVAGLVPQGNFNNVTTTTGAGVALVDSNNAATGVTLTFAGQGLWTAGTGTANANQKLYNGYLDGSDTGTAPLLGVNSYSLSNVPAGTYNLIIYAQPDGLDGRDQDYTLNGDVSTKVFLSSDAGSSFDTFGFVRGSATSQDGAGATGNYVEFDNISLASVGTISWAGHSDTFRNFANGFQLVNAPEPATLSLLGVGGVALLGRRRRKQA
jgi:PEP-CTERM motif